MSSEDFVTVRRPADASFRVIPADLDSGAAEGYDLTLMRRLATEGQLAPISVRPAAGGRFKVVGGGDQLAAIRMLSRINNLAYDNIRGLLRPARKVFALIRCRVRRPRASAPPQAEPPR